MNEPKTHPSFKMPDPAIQSPTFDADVRGSQNGLRIIADNGQESWTVRCGSEGRVATAAQMDASVLAGTMPAEVARVIRRQLAWTALPGVQIESKPILSGDLRISVHRESVGRP
ncbi:MAG: hypothetical protein AB8G96_09705 [Phycisphaerales bacterium]